MIELRDVSKFYRNVCAVKDIHLTFRRGEIHALIGHNGAGKSTIINLLAGVIQPTTGYIYIDGVRMDKYTPETALSQGICVCQQDTMLFEGLSITENLFLGNERKTKAGFFDWKRMGAETEQMLKMFHINADPQKRAKFLSLAEKALLQFARALLRNPRVLVLDELTDALTYAECAIVYEKLDQLRKEGLVIVYVTHRINEAIAISDRVSILRDGQVCEIVEPQNVNPDYIAKTIIGPFEKTYFPRIPSSMQQKVLTVSHISTHFLNDISFSLHKGEALGIVGLLGSGRSSLMRAIVGVDPVKSGKITVFSPLTGKPVPARGIHRSIGYVSENNNGYGLMPQMSVLSNITIRVMDKINHFHLVGGSRERLLGKKYSDKLDIKTNSLQSPVSHLSNGNKQKTLIARNLASGCNIYLFDEATKGVDSAGKVEIYNIINELLRKGASIILASSDFSELLGMCDRLLVISKGRLTKECNYGVLNEHELQTLLEEA